MRQRQEGFKVMGLTWLTKGPPHAHHPQTVA